MNKLAIIIDSELKGNAPLHYASTCLVAIKQQGWTKAYKVKKSEDWAHQDQILLANDAGKYCKNPEYFTVQEGLLVETLRPTFEDMDFKIFKGLLPKYRDENYGS